MRTLGLIRAATPPPPDLWPRLAARLRADEHVWLHMPAFGWREAAAIAAVVATLALAPDPLGLLAAAGVL